MVGLYIKNNEDNLEIDNQGNLTRVYEGLAMSESEAKKLFTFEETGSEDDDLPELKVTGYLGSNSNVTIPKIIYDDNGVSKYLMAEIGGKAFSSEAELYPVPQMFIQKTDEEYLDMTVSAVYEALGSSYSGDITNKNLNEKNAKLIEAGIEYARANLGLTFNESDFIYNDENGVPYIYIRNGYPLTKEAVNCVIKKVAVFCVSDSANKSAISTNAFYNQTAITELYFPIYRSTAESLEEFVGYDTKWGANNAAIYIGADNYCGME